MISPISEPQGPHMKGFEVFHIWAILTYTREWSRKEGIGLGILTLSFSWAAAVMIILYT